jgi:hypothetical protein
MRYLIAAFFLLMTASQVTAGLALSVDGAEKLY